MLAGLKLIFLFKLKISCELISHELISYELIPFVHDVILKCLILYSLQH